MNLTKIIALTAGISLTSLVSCCNQDRIKEEALQDFFIMMSDEKTYLSNKKEIDNQIKECVQLVKKDPKKFKLGYKEVPAEELTKIFNKINAGYENGSFCSKRKIREEAINEYIKFSSEKIKENPLFNFFAGNTPITRINREERLEKIKPPL